MTSKNTVRTISGILIILIVIVGIMLWSRTAPKTGAVFTSKFGYTVSLPTVYKTYEDAHGMVAFPVLKYVQGTTTLDYHATYGANKDGISIVAMLPDAGLTDMLFDAMTQTQATSTLPLPKGATSMRSGAITPSDEKSPEGSYRGENYSFKTARGVYFLNVFSTNASDQATRLKLAKEILGSFQER